MNDRPVDSDSALSQIDFAKYRTPELVATIADLLSLPGKVKVVAIWAAIGCAASVLLIAWLVFDAIPLLVFVIVEAYTIPAGLVAGIFFGIAELIRRSLNSMLSIVDLLLEKTVQIATDVRALRSGEQTLPPPGELVQVVYAQLISPIVEDVIAGGFGWIGKPILWLYRSTLDRLVRLVIGRFVPKSIEELNEAQAERMSEGVQRASEQVADNEDAIVASLAWARIKVASVGGWLRLLVMMPCYAIFAAILLLLVIPIAIFCYLFAIEDTDVVAMLVQVARQRVPIQ